MWCSMRPGALAVVAVVSALLGGTTALLVGKSVGWIDDDGEPQTVLVSAGEGESSDAGADPLARNAAEPVTGNGFDPAEIYAKRAAGVVTIFALFEGHSGVIDAAAAQGSGFVATRRGYILTNSHVITTAGEEGAAASEDPETAETVYVQYRDGERVPAEIVGWDPFDDVGVIKVDPRDHPVSPVPLGDSRKVVVGEPVAAIGSPFGQESSLSVGVVSATERSIASLTSEYNLPDAIQTDAPINRGNSGGPMFNAEGEVIGINAQIRTDSGNAEGVGFAVPINAAKRSMQQLIVNGEVHYAWLGITTLTVTPRVAERFGYGAERGAAVQVVVAGSPAAEAGMRGGRKAQTFQGEQYCPGGDLVVAVEGRPVDSAEDVVREVNERLLPGEAVELTVLRGDERRTITVVMGERPANPPDRNC
jgi:2-alkenal reductase